MIAEQLERLLDGGEIKRYHVKRTHRTQTVGAHSARVATLCMLVSPYCSTNLLKAALVHDISELTTGDVPSPVKWANPVLKAELSRITTEYEIKNGLRFDLHPEEQAVLGWADRAEGCLFSIEELMLGNRYMAGTYGRYFSAANDYNLDAVETSHIRTNIRVVMTHIQQKGNALV